MTQPRTPEEIEELKKSLKHDDTEGFEARLAELLAYEDECERQAAEREEARANLVREQTGVIDADIVTSLHTWNEIEEVLFESDAAETQIQVAQVRATLLQAAQLKRIADALERMEEGEVRVSLKDSLSQSMIDLMKRTK